RVMVDLRPGARAAHQPTHGAAGARHPGTRRQSPILRTRPGAALADPADHGFRAELVTPGSPACRLAWTHQSIVTHSSEAPTMSRSSAEIIEEYGPFEGSARVNGVSYDGRTVWLATGDKLQGVDPESGKVVRAIDAAAHAGTAFDGRYLFQIAEATIRKIDPQSGRVLATI